MDMGASEPPPVGISCSFDPLATVSRLPRLLHSEAQPKNSILRYLPVNLLAEIIQHVSQFDLFNLLQCCLEFYALACDRLYKKVTIMLNAEFPVRYNGNRKLYIEENGISNMDTSLILTIEDLFRFLLTLKRNPSHVQRVKFFVFDKCYPDNFLKRNIDISRIQSDIIDFFGKESCEMNFLHITFVDFVTGIERLTKFLRNRNIRNKIFKLFVTSYEDLFCPVTPVGLTNLFMMLDENELMNIDEFDLLNPPFDVLNSLSTLTCSTNNQFGLEILRKLKISNNCDDSSKLKLRGLTAFHCHKESLLTDEDVFIGTRFRLNQSHELMEYFSKMNKKLLFKVISDKIDLTYLTHLYLKIDCVEHRVSQCKCFPEFFKEFSVYLSRHNGLPNLTSLELELFPNLEWLRPHQILENILTPLGIFIKTLAKLSRLTIDFSTPAFKMFDNSMGMSSMILNRLNEKLIEAFFLCFFTSRSLGIIKNLKTLQLPDFLTSFIYYKPNFYESMLHVCDCWGCYFVLEKLKKNFFPLNEEDEIQGSDEQASFYILIGFILGKLQTDREVCIPIKQKTYSFRDYPIYKGQPHTLHSHFHRNVDQCFCNIELDPDGRNECCIDNLATIYIIHQLRPIIEYISSLFHNLESIMIHGIYYEYNEEKGRMVPIFDSEDYPEELLKNRVESTLYEKPEMPFGLYKRAKYDD